MTKLTKTFCPYGSFMACEFLPQNVTRGGIQLPDAGGDNLPVGVECRKAIVVAVGPEVRYYKPDDVILVRAGQFLLHEGQKYAMVPEEETFGCVSRELEPFKLEERIKIEAETNMKKLVFEEASRAVADMMKTEMLRQKKQ